MTLSLAALMLLASAFAEPSKKDEKAYSLLVYTCSVQQYCSPEQYTKADKKFIEKAKSEIPPHRNCGELKQEDQRELLKGMKAISWMFRLIGQSTCLSKASDGKGQTAIIQ